MKTLIKFFLATLLLLAMASSAFAFSAMCEGGQTLYYTITSSSSPYTVEVVSENAYSPYYTTYPTGNLTIPSSVTYNSRTYSVTSIGDYAFYGCSRLTSVTIPNSVTSIADNAFYGCSRLTTVNFNATNCTSMGNSSYSVFSGCTSLSTLNIGSNVKKIPDYAFYGCSGLTSVTIPNSVRSIGNYAFKNCSGLTSVNFNATNCTSMGNSSYPVFSGCTSLSTLNIGSNVTNIPDYAFYGCSGLTGTLTIPNSVTNIGSYAFYNCSGLTEPVYNASWFAYIPIGYATEYTIPNGIQHIAGGAFYNRSELTSVTIPNSVTSIGSAAFQNCTGVTTVNFNATNCTTMGSSSSPVFSGCTSLVTLNIGDSVITIPQYAFYGCSGLSSVTIPDLVTSIGNSAFANCIGLTTVNFNATNCTAMGNTTGLVFSGCTSLTTLNIGDNVTKIPTCAFYDCSSLTCDLTIPNSVTSIGNSAFQNCSGLTGDLTIPNSVTSIGGYAFYNCSGLTGGLTIPNSVTSIGGCAFYNCSGLTGDLTIPNSLTSIGNSVFQDCGGLTGGLTIPNSVTSIGNSAFQNCSGLTGDLTIPNSVTSIGNSAFYNCSGLTSVYYTGDVAGWCGITFGNGTANPLSCAHNLYINNVLVTDLVILETITEIKAYAFGGASCLTSVTIPNSVTSIGTSAFSGCTGLVDMTIPFVGGSATATTASVSTLFGYIFGYETSDTTGTTKQKYSSSNSIYAYIPSSLRSVTITSGSLQYGAFYNCSMLTSVTIGESVSNIGEYAFANCSGLTSVTIPNSVTRIGSCAFSGCSGLVEMTIPFTGYGTTVEGTAGLYHDYWGMFGFIFGTSYYEGSIAASQYTGSSTITYCIPRGLSTVTVTGRVEKNAFSRCNMLKSVTICGSVGATPFWQCSSIEELTIPSVGQLGAFFDGQGNSGFTQVKQYYNSSDYHIYYIPNRLRSVTVTGGGIGYGAFCNCSMLTSVTIGENVTSIDQRAFYGCSSGLDIYAKPTTPPTNSGSNGYSSTLWVPCGSAEAYRAATNWSRFSDIRESRWYLLNVSSANRQQGTASVTQQPDCIDGIATIAATPNRGYAFSQWNDGNTDNPRTITVTSDVEYTASFVTLPSYTITVLSADETTGTVSGGGIYYDGETATITATPLDGYGFVSWDDGSTDTLRTFVVTEDAIYTATFGAMRIIAVHSNDETMGTASGSGSYAEGTEVEISATPTEHYHFVQWNDGNTDNPRTITVTGDATYTATFTIDQHTITVESANASMGSVSEGGTYGYGTEIQISATANEGYSFVAWNDGNTNNPRTITVTEDATYTATFGTMFTITVLSADETMGTVIGDGEYVEGAEIQITAVPNEHYHFVHWIIEENPTRDIITDNPLTITIIGDVTYTAVFAIDQHTITVESNNVTMGTVSEGGTYDYGTEIQISATANEGYGFAAWNDGNTDNPRTIVVTEDITYTATFGVLRTISVVSTDETMGTVQGTGEYIEGTTVQITAIPNEHYHFVHWIDEENPTRDFNTDNPRTITVTGNMTYTAVFAIDQHTITVESDDTGMGTVSESGTYDYGTEIQISASARDGYQFVSWNDGNTDNPRTITVVADATYIASFVSVTGIEKTAAFEIALFPNPATDILNITSSETISEIEIVNALGQVVYRTEVNADNAVCDVNGLANGVYVVKIYGNPRTSTGSASGIVQKFIKE